MAALCGEKTLAELSVEFGVHPTMISSWKQELVKRAGELFARGNKAPAVDDAQKVIDDLHRKIGQLQVERDFLAGQPAISLPASGGQRHRTEAQPHRILQLVQSAASASGARVANTGVSDHPVSAHHRIDTGNHRLHLGAFGNPDRHRVRPRADRRLVSPVH
jgi:transposase